MIVSLFNSISAHDLENKFYLYAAGLIGVDLRRSCIDMLCAWTEHWHTGSSCSVERLQ